MTCGFVRVGVRWPAFAVRALAGASSNAAWSKQAGESCNMLKGMEAQAKLSADTM